MPKSAEFDALVATDAANYRLRVGGSVETPVELALADLRARPKQGQIATHFCILGWLGIAKGVGVPMRDAIDPFKPTAEAPYSVLDSFADGGDGGC